MDVNSYKEQAATGKRWCADCQEYYEMGSFCGYGKCMCKIYGSLDADQKERHPDQTADTCSNYKQKDGPRWFEL